MKIITKIKEQIKSITTTLAYACGIAVVVYAVVFAIKQRGNGNNFLVNFLIGIIEAIVNSANFAIKKWLSFRGYDKE